MSDALPFTSLTAALASQAERTPGRTAYVFLADGEEEQHRLTYAELDGRARAIAVALRREVAPGERALLLYPPGLDFIVAFFGCLYAGVIAVPAYPPRSPRMMPRLLAILADAQPKVALAASLQRVRGWLAQTPEAAALHWLTSDELEPTHKDWEPAPPSGDAVAFLQYTSGSTSTPKGVIVTHANLAHNQRVIQDACGHSGDSVFVSWLPPYHDLGLIGNLLQATWVGAPCVLMAPVAFLQSPSRWLRAISRYRGTTSGGPNFAYDLCLRRVTPAEIERLDLSSWQVAFNGAEPVREATLAGFAAAFEPAGFRAGALYPCYGLAEATLMVSGGRPGKEPVVRELGGRRLVGCGRALWDLEVEIVDPGSGAACPPGAVGEVWVAGGSVAQGYWNRPEETAQTFGATLPDGSGRWLRTGDLGVLDGGELFIAGRLKDLIILRGRNHYPQDLEGTAGEAHPALSGGAGAAFSVDLDGEERLVIVHEAERHAARPEEIAAAVRQAITRDHEALVQEVVLVPAGGVPRTTSGKVQRRACRDLYLRGELRVLGASRLSPAVAAEYPLTETLPGSLDWLRRAFATVARVAPSRIDPDRPLSASGLDSLAAVELKHSIEEATGVPIPLSDLLDGMTLRELELRVDGGAAAVAAPLPRAGTAAGEHPLSWNQHSLWFLHRLAPEGAAYNIAGAARLQITDSVDAVDAEVLRRAVQALVDRHPMLRATFADTPDGPVQRVAERAEAAFAVLEVHGWSDEEVRRQLHAEAFRPFDLAAGPPLRALLLRRGGESFFVLAMHHISADFWSMTVLVRALGAFAAGETPPPPPAALYTDFARGQRERLEGPEGDRLWEHWRERLAGTPQLDLPTDRPRQPVQALRGGSWTSLPSAERAEALHRLVAAHGCTPFVALLAAWQAVLGRWSGQETFLVGAPMAGRSARAWSDVVGYFVNPVPLRADLARSPTVRELMARARSTALDALAHQELPFALLTERLQPERDPSRPPLIAALLTFEKAPAPELAPLAAFAVGVPGVRLDLRGLVLESLPLDPPAAQLDLSLIAAELPEGLAIFLQWDADLFDEATVRRMLGHLDHLLAGMADAGCPVAELPLLASEERDQILLAWSGAENGAPAGSGCLHELFEAAAARFPQATALVAGDRRWTYDALNRQANRLAHHLRRLGAEPEQRVGVLMGRSGEMVAALLGILKAGAAYVPLDPTYPTEWLSFAAKDARIVLLLTEGRLAGKLVDWREVDALADALALEPEENPEPLADSGHLAYVMYTSGSTGRPKGVALEHRAPVERMGWARAAFPPEALAGVLASTSICFDLSVFEIFVPLSWGGTVILAENALALPALLAAGEVTLINTVPSAMAELAAAELPPGLRTVNLAGEALPPQLAERIYRHAHIEQVLNLYGPTEDATYSTWTRIERGTTRVSIGRPLPGTRAYVLDRHLGPVPGGVPGELFLAGAGGARGYLGRPDLTAERFLPDPFATVPGGRLYRTGDLARWLASGDLEHLGRLDHQIKVRGFRIELEEIERVLREHPQVREAVIVVRESTEGGNALAAYVAPAAAGAEDLRRHIGGRLPAYMIPSSFQLLAALPRTLNGKVDRKALPAATGTEVAFVAPRNPMEEMLADIWTEVLGLERIGIHESFFDLGGHSLLATRVISRLRSNLGVELPLRSLFEQPTVAELSTAIEEARHSGADRAAPPLVPVPREGPSPLSFAQQRLWFIDQLEPGSPLYNMPGALRVDGPLDSRVLTLCLGEIVRRHEALRTVFVACDGTPVQVIQSAALFSLPIVDLSGLPETTRETPALTLMAEEAGRPFDLARGPLLRGALLRLAEGDHVVLLTLHHIVSDAWSMGILVRELKALYPAFAEGRPSSMPELPLQYADFAVWQSSWLQGEILESEISFWRRQLAGLPPLLELPTDRPRPAAQSFRGASRPVRLTTELTRQAQILGRREGATLFMVLLAGFQLLLTRYSSQEDLAVGTPVAGRNRVEIEGLIGFFVNTLVLRGDLAGVPSFRELLGRVRETALAAWLHQDVPFEKLVEELSPERSLAQTPLVQVMFVLQNAPVESLEIRDLRLHLVSGAETTAKLDLTLSLEEHEGGLLGTVEYATDLFDVATVERLIAGFERLLAGATAVPDLPAAKLPLLAEAQRHQILTEWNETVMPPQGGLLHDLLETQAVRTPDAPAAAFGGETLTYAELHARAERLAHRLRGLGCGPESRVVIALERSLDLIVSLLGVLKAGAVYVPLDAQYPRERLAFLIEDSLPAAVVTQDSLRDRLPIPPGLPVLVPAALPEVAGAIDARDVGDHGDASAAYVIYTSGSTGRPKGVVVSHSAAASFVRDTRETYGLGSEDRVLQFASISFDASAEEIWPALASGSTLVLRPEEMISSIPHFLCELGRLGITVLDLPTAFWHEMVVEMEAGALELPRSLRLVILGGEELLADRLALWNQRVGSSVRLVNTYGPTEATVVATRRELTGRDLPGPVSIGRPMAGVRTYVLDRFMTPVPPGVHGEIWIGGTGVGRGYLWRPDLTAERFVPDPFACEPGSRLYRTGDLAFLRPGGDLVFSGRVDQQVKIRGFRIELGEIEAALSALAGVRQAVVIVRQDRTERGAGDRRLVAYIAGTAAAGELRRALRERLPEHMVPASFVTLAALPLTPSGKVDRKALSALEREPLPAESFEPRTPIEELLAGIWAELLERERVGVQESFFDLGGHSLLAARLTARVRDAFGVELPLRTLFEAPSVRELAKRLDALMRQDRGISAPPLERASRALEPPLSFAQHSLWLIDRVEGGNAAYNMAAAIELAGRLDISALAGSFRDVVERHEILRTSFGLRNGEPRQRIHSRMEVPLPLADLSALPLPEDRLEEARQAVQRDLWRPFDLEQAPLLRTLLVRLAPDLHILALCQHHAVSDAWSVGILVRELVVCYTARACQERPILPALSIQYADWSHWQREWLRGDALDRLLAFWRGQLGSAPPPARPPAMRPPPAVRTSRGGHLTVQIPPTLEPALRALARQEGVTLFMLLLAVFEALLHASTQQEDLVLVVAVAGRDRLETEGLIGCFLNMLPLRTSLAGDPPFRWFLQRVRETCLDAFAHQDLPFERLVGELHLRNTEGRSPFQVAFGVQSTPPSLPELPGLTVQPLDWQPELARLDLTLWVHERPEGLSAAWTYSADLFERGEVERLHGSYETLLAAVVADPEARLRDLALSVLADRESSSAAAHRRWEELKKHKLRKSQRRSVRG